MARVEYPQAVVNSPNQAEVSFRFQIDGTSDPNFVVPANCGVSNVVRNSAGLFSVYLENLYPVMIKANATLMCASASGVKAEIVDYTASTGVLRVRTIGGGSVTAAVSDSLLITCPTAANLADADYIEINDGINVGRRYEFDISNDGVAAGSVDVGSHTATTAAQVAATLKTAIEATQLGLTVVDNADGTLTVTSRAGAILYGVESISHASGTIARTAGSAPSDVDGNVAADPADNDWVCVDAVFCKTSTLAPTGAI